MSRTIYRVGYLARLLLYVVRLIVFWAYRFVLFTTKPGARFIVPAVLAGAVWYFAGWLDQSLMVQGLIAEAYSYAGHYAYRATGTPPSFVVYPPSTTLYGAAAGFAVVFYIFSRAIRPIVAAFPMVSPPSLPRFWLPPPVHKVPTVRARIAVPTLSGRAWEGEEARLNACLPARMQALLTPPTVRDVTKLPVVEEVAPLFSSEEAESPPPVPEAGEGGGVEPPRPDPDRSAPPRRRGRFIPPEAALQEAG